MILIGTRFATFRDEGFLVKSEDLHVPERSPVRCYREALGFMLASRLGFAVPPATLRQHPHHGRVVTRRWLQAAHVATDTELAALAPSAQGVRVLLLDLLVANRDRRRDNILMMNGELMPIDFNVAFGFADETARTEPPDQTIMRWFGLENVLALPHGVRATFDTEAARFHHVLDERYLRWSVAQVPDDFLTSDERSRVLAGLLTRRACLSSWLADWWRAAVEPIHRITEAYNV